MIYHIQHIPLGFGPFISLLIGDSFKMLSMMMIRREYIMKEVSMQYVQTDQSISFFHAVLGWALLPAYI